jgi:uncharacterized membrane protein YphA (DoxX/SURF4 family)
MKRWIDYWNAFWFPEATMLRLSLCRIIVVAAQLFVFFPHLGYQIDLLKRDTGFVNPQLIVVVISSIIPTDVFFTPAVFKVLYYVTALAGMTCLIGLFTRLSALGFALGNWIFIAHTFSYGDYHHPQSLLCIFLMLLAFSPSGGCLSIDELIRSRRYRYANAKRRTIEKVEFAVWPLKLIQVLLAWTYFSTGLTKLLYSGFGWMNGYTLQQYMLNDASASGSRLGLWMAQQHILAQGMSIGTILFELFFFVMLIVPWSVPFFLIAGTFFHTGIYITMAAPFFQHIILYSVFIDFDRWQMWLSQERLFANGFIKHCGALGFWSKPWRSID